MGALTIKRIPALAFLAIGLAWLAGPQAASASTVSVSGSTLVLDAGPGEFNIVSFQCTSTSECLALDQTGPFTAGPGCEPSGGGYRCTAAAFDSIQVTLRDGDDVAALDPSSAAQLPMNVDGGEGTDTLTGGGGGDTVIGDDGPDNLSGLGEADLVDGGSGDDVVAGGDGDDSLRGGCGNDALGGEEGDDTIAGNISTAPGTVTACRSSGGGVEQDDDRLFGGPDNDGLFDSAGSNRFRGEDGNDNIRGVIRASSPKRLAASLGSGRDRMIVSGIGAVDAKDGFRDRVVCEGDQLRVRADRTLDKVGGTCPDAHKR